MKTLILAAIRCSLMFTAVAALSLAYPASVQAVPTTYQYTGNPFTFVIAPYTTSDFVTAMVTLAGPLGANMPLTKVTPTAFTLTDGVQTISNLSGTRLLFLFATDAQAHITAWLSSVDTVTLRAIHRDSQSGEVAPDTDAGHLAPTTEPASPSTSTPGVWSRASPRRTRGLPYH